MENTKDRHACDAIAKMRGQTYPTARYLAQQNRVDPIWKEECPYCFKIERENLDHTATDGKN